MKRVLLTALVLFALTPCLAKSYYYEYINSNYTILPDGDIRVIESQLMSFSGEFSFVYRDFYLDKVTDVVNFRVSVNGEYLPVEVKYDGGSKRFTWRLPIRDEIIEFKLEYTLVEPFTVLKSEDYLFATLVFKDRTVPVNSSTNYIKFPNDINLNELSSSHGVFIYNSMIKQSSLTQVSSDTLLLTAPYLNEYSHLDFEIHLPKGVINPKSSLKYFNQYYAFELGLLFYFIGLALVITLIFDVKRRYKYHKLYGRDPELSRVIHVEDLNPALAGFIIDEQVDYKEVLGTIIDLAIKGYLYIREVHEGFFSIKNVYLMKVKSASGLNSYERLLFNSIFKLKDKVNLNELRYSLNYSFFINFKAKVHEEAVVKGFYEKNPVEVRTKYLSLFIILPLIITIFSFFNIGIIHSYYEFDSNLINISLLSGIHFPISLICLIINAILGYSMPRRTELGVAARIKYVELKDFIIKFPLTEGRIFDEYLPEAIALGVQKRWVKKAEELGYEPNWYRGGTFNYAAFSGFYSSFMRSGGGGGSRGGGGGFGGGGGAGGGGGGAG